MSIHKKVWYAPNTKEAYGDLEIKAVIDSLNDGWLAGFGPKSIQFEQSGDYGSDDLLNYKILMEIDKTTLHSLQNVKKGDKNE